MDNPAMLIAVIIIGAIAGLVVIVRANARHSAILETAIYAKRIAEATEKILESIESKRPHDD